eukprot:gene24676-1595_t
MFLLCQEQRREREIPLEGCPGKQEDGFTEASAYYADSSNYVAVSHLLLTENISTFSKGKSKKKTKKLPQFSTSTAVKYQDSCAPITVFDTITSTLSSIGALGAASVRMSRSAQPVVDSQSADDTPENELRFSGTLRNDVAKEVVTQGLLPGNAQPKHFASKGFLGENPLKQNVPASEQNSYSDRVMSARGRRKRSAEESECAPQGGSQCGQPVNKSSKVDQKKIATTTKQFSNILTKDSESLAVYTCKEQGHPPIDPSLLSIIHPLPYQPSSGIRRHETCMPSIGMWMDEHICMPSMHPSIHYRT